MRLRRYRKLLLRICPFTSYPKFTTVPPQFSKSYFKSGNPSENKLLAQRNTTTEEELKEVALGRRMKEWDGDKSSVDTTPTLK